MPRVLCYNGAPIAVVEFLPNNAFGGCLQEVEGELCGLVSPDEGLANIVDVSDEDLLKLRAGELVEAVVNSAESEDDLCDCD